jgi:hypothetical protein
MMFHMSDIMRLPKQLICMKFQARIHFLWHTEEKPVCLGDGIGG